MSNRRRLRRERLEIYLVYLILAYRQLILVGGLLLLVYAIVMMFINLLVGSASLLPAIFMLLLSSSYKITIFMARMGAWIGTLWSYDD